MTAPPYDKPAGVMWWNPQQPVAGGWAHRLLCPDCQRPQHVGVSPETVSVGIMSTAPLFISRHRHRRHSTQPLALFDGCVVLECSLPGMLGRSTRLRAHVHSPVNYLGKLVVMDSRRTPRVQPVAQRLRLEFRAVSVLSQV